MLLSDYVSQNYDFIETNSTTFYLLERMVANEDIILRYRLLQLMYPLRQKTVNTSSEEINRLKKLSYQFADYLSANVISYDLKNQKRIRMNISDFKFAIFNCSTIPQTFLNLFHKLEEIKDSYLTSLFEIEKKKVKDLEDQIADLNIYINSLVSEKPSSIETKNILCVITDKEKASKNLYSLMGFFNKESFKEFELMKNNDIDCSSYYECHNFALIEECVVSILRQHIIDIDGENYFNVELKFFLGIIEEIVKSFDIQIKKYNEKKDLISCKYNSTNIFPDKKLKLKNNDYMINDKEEYYNNKN